MSVSLDHESLEHPNNEEESIVRCGTTSGPLAIRFHRAWAPHGYDRAVQLFESGFYDNSHFYRVVPGFLVQFGISYNKELRPLGDAPIPDDPQLVPPIRFDEGIVSYAGSGDNSRTSQLFIAYGPSDSLGTAKWETPLGKVFEGMENVKKFYSYGDMPPWGNGPVQGRVWNGPQYIEQNFPLSDRFTTCTVERLNKAKEEHKVSAAEEERQQMVDKKIDIAESHFIAQDPDLVLKSPKTLRVLKQKAEDWIETPSHRDYAFVALGLVVLAVMVVVVLHSRRRHRGSNDKSS